MVLWTLWMLVAAAFLQETVATSHDPVFSPHTLSDSAGNTADNDSHSWAPLSDGDTYKSDSPEKIGSQSYYSMVNTFINVVFPAGISIDLIVKGLNGEISDLTQTYSDCSTDYSAIDMMCIARSVLDVYTVYFIVYAICILIGFLFLLIFPFVCCCVCCCRTVGKCGGKRHQTEKEAQNSCRKTAFVIGTFICFSFLLAGGIITFVNNNYTSTALKNIATETNNNLDDIKTYVNNTMQQARHIGRTNFDFMKALIYRNLDNVDYLVGLPLRRDIEVNTGILTTLTLAATLVQDLDDADTALSDVETAKTNLETAITNLDTAITAVQTNLDNIFTTCGASCPAGSRPDYSSMDVNVDPLAFPDLSGPRTSLDNAKNANLTANIIEAENELNSVPERVFNDSLTVRNDIKQDIAGLSDDIDPMIDQITDWNDLLVADNSTMNLDSIAQEVSDFQTTIDTYDSYRGYGTLGLSAVVLLISFLGFFGLLLGLCGTSLDDPPDKRSGVANCGGTLLILSSVLMFLFATLFMLLTFFLFIPGAPLQRYICHPVNDLAELEEILQAYDNERMGAGNYFMSDLLLSNKTIQLTPTNILKDCKAGKSAYDAFKFENVFDIVDLTNFSQHIDIQQEIDTINVDVSGVVVYTTDLQNQLDDIEQGVNINFADFYTELSNSPTTADLSDLADDLDSYVATHAPSMPDATEAEIEAEADSLRAIETTEYAAVQAAITALNNSVAAMETAVAALPSKLTTLDTNLQATDTYIQTNTTAVLTSILQSYATDLLDIANSFRNFTLDAVTTDMGKCNPLWNIYNSLLGHTLCHNVVSALNGFWFSLGWCAFFFIPSIIFSMKLAKYFHRSSNSEEENGRFNNKVYPEDEVVAQMPSKPDRWLRKNKTAPENISGW